MPHINRIRVNNVKYNFGTQSYEDFCLKPFGHNMLYDLANGGGKSVLMLLMLQTVLPNCSLDDKQPVEKLFRTGEGSQTIHSLIEWKLDPADVVNGFRYMTTGFCARKAQNAEEKKTQTASIDYFNYCIFYRDYNANDICNLPLVKNKEKITYGGLRKYLKELERDNSLIVRIFDRRGEYLGFIADYGLYESEWEIIRGINRTEGHVRTYFETNYRTTRKVVEELLIEEIIQKSFAIRGGQESEETMAGTLLEMKDKLVELSKRKSEIGNYDRQMEQLSLFAERTAGLKGIYEKEKELRREIGQIYRLALHAEEVLKERGQACEKQLTEMKNTIWKLSERIDAAHYFSDCAKTKQLEKRKKQLEGIVEAQSAEFLKEKQKLLLRESANDYLEYREEKAKRDETAAQLAAMFTEKSALLEQVRFLAHHKKKELSQQQKEMEREIAAQKAQRLSLQICWQEAAEKKEQLTGEIACEKARAEQFEERLAALERLLHEKKSQVGILVLEESAQKKAEYEAEIGRLFAEKEESRKKLDAAAEAILQTEKALFACSLKQQQLEKEETGGTEFFADYEQKKELADRLLLVYGAKDYEKLIERIREREIAARIKGEELRGQIKSLKERLSRFSDGIWGAFLEEQPAAAERKEYIRTRHNRQVQTGREYLAGLKEEEREELLKDYPYLPYAFIVEEGLSELNEDEKLREGEEMPLFPIIKEAALRNRREIVLKEDILIISKSFEKFFKEGEIEREQSRLSAKLQECEQALVQLADKRETCREDEKSMWEFWDCYEKRSREYRSRQEERKRQLSRCKQEQEELTAKREGLRAQEAACKEQLKQLEAKRKVLLQEAEILARLAIEFDETQQLAVRLAQTKGRLAAHSAEQEALAAKMKQLGQKQEEIAQRCGALETELERMLLLWNEKYQKYDVPGEYGECEFSGEALLAQLAGKCEAYEKEHSEADDKNKLLQSYESAMNRALRAIETRGVQLLQLKELEGAGGLYRTSEPDLKRLRAEQEKTAQKLEEERRELNQVTAEWNRLHGKTGQLAAELTKRYGTAMELKLSEGEIEEYVQNNRAQIEHLKKEEENIGKQREAFAHEAQLLTDVRKDMERMAHGAGLSLQQSADCFRQDEEGGMQQSADGKLAAAPLQERFQLFEVEFARANANRKKAREEFAHSMAKTLETLVLFGAASLADEMRESVKLPENEQDTDLLVRNLNEVKDCLALEKSRIESGIEDIINLKENFENQCLQRCINIRAELDRLPALSKITLAGEQIPIISLQIPYVREEVYKERMSAYIDELVENVENFKEQADRLSYIRTALSFKKLFAVIVTDMNAIRLSLYKRERIREQSRHLRYEEAVGSTGQSQGIYIQFLIAIINYITNINSGRGENAGLGKVIFIDNPFGAAKDIYIWEPIFELLKTNQVQLIVPARGTTPAITGRFDVNYVLGQKLVDNRQQTVVVDYHSSVLTQELEYIPLQFEQESFDFL